MTTLALVHGSAGVPVAVLCDPAGDPPGQRWFTVVLSDSPGPGEHEGPVCVDCLLALHPNLGRGLDVALEHMGASWERRGLGAGA